MLELLATIMAEIGMALGDFEGIRRKLWFKIFTIIFIIIVIFIILRLTTH